MLNELPGELAVQVGGIGQRHSQDGVRGIVVALCWQRDYRAEELALLLGRNVESLRQRYLRLRDGRLTMTLPDKPNDPQQAYRTARRDASDLAEHFHTARQQASYRIIL